MNYLGGNNQDLFDPKTFIDKWGLLDKLSNPDGGDSGHREGTHFSLLGMMRGSPHQFGIGAPSLERYNNVMEKIHCYDGIILRHCNPDYDASDWDRMSRDQLQPNIIAAGYWSKYELKRLFKGHLRRGFLFTNNVRRNGATKSNHGGTEGRDYSWKLPDLTGPEIWGNFIRATGSRYLYPLLVIFDIELFVGSILWRYFPKHNIAMNHTLSLLQSMDIMPTPLSWLSGKIMPVEKLIPLIEDHFQDFKMDMRFFGPMFSKAYQSIKN